MKATDADEDANKLAATVAVTTVMVDGVDRLQLVIETDLQRPPLWVHEGMAAVTPYRR